ncbi:hypothetical protein [Psychroflexus aestuariivivens]|uniref:hypothetical protein n=1 Tax=Psychroflexus aestuariivivens TaxID=1795040 RepID=UPI000FDB1888|nr:hypothetical protein [Psychroflexus aestuariivivens]
MLTNYTKIVLMTVVGLFANMLIAQTGHEVHKPNPDKYDQFIEEVYGEYADELVFSKPLRYKSIKKMLNERVEFQSMTSDLNQKAESFDKLSDYDLNTAYVNNLTRDVAFMPSNFNPLKYDIDFYGLDRNQYIITENNDFLIIIKAQNIN